MHRGDWAWPAGTVRLWAENEWLDALERQVGFTSSNSETPPSNGGPRKQPAPSRGPVATSLAKHAWLATRYKQPAPCRGTVAMASAAAPSAASPAGNGTSRTAASGSVRSSTGSPCRARMRPPRYQMLMPSGTTCIDTERWERQPSGGVGTNPSYSSGSGSISTTSPSRMTITPVPV